MKKIDNDFCLKYLRLLLNKKLEARIIAIINNRIGNIYWQSKKYQLALDYYLYDLNYDKNYISCSNVAGVYKKLQKYKSSIYYYELAIEYFEALKDLKDDAELAVIYSGLARSYYGLQMYQKCIDYCKLKLGLEKKYNYYIDIIYYCHIINDFDKIKFYLNEIDKVFNDKKSDVDYMFYTAVLLYENNDLQQVHAAIDLYSSIIEQYKDIHDMRYIYRWIGKAWEKIGDYDEAMKNYKMSIIGNEYENSYYLMANLYAYNVKFLNMKEALCNINKYFELHVINGNNFYINEAIQLKTYIMNEMEN